MTATASVPTTEQLVTAFRAAIIAANRADLDKSDGGTCNFDNAFLNISTRYKNRVYGAAMKAGLTVREARWGGRSGFFVDVRNCGNGQAANRTRVAEAIAKTLEANGIDAGMFYQMD